MNKDESLKAIGEKIKDMRVCMFVTMAADGSFKARPMGMQDVEFDGVVWFMTDRRSNKAKEIEANPQVGLEFAHGNGVRFASLAGTATMLVDEEKIRKFWNPFYEAWFEGPEDENITLVRVEVSRAEYWDNKGGRFGGLADMAIGAVTGKTNTLDEHEAVDLG